MVYRRFFKSVIDLVLAVFALVILIPVFIIVSIAIKLDSRGPVFFVQNRLGKHGNVFRIIKFRSMRTERIEVADHRVIEEDSRITKVGKFIRKTSIDELPQLINIIKGEMSFIGPRPPVVTYPKRFEEYTDFEKQRFDVKPGISGLAQIRCREVHEWNINIPIDVEYVRNYSFFYDTNLFLRSLLAFFRTDNIYSKE